MNINDFLRIENKYNMYELEVDGINYWEYFRFQIWNVVICSEKLDMKRTREFGKESILYKMKLVFNILKQCAAYLTAPKSKVDVCFIDHERRVRQGAYYECIYTERLVEQYPDSVVLERPYNYSHLTPVKTPNLLYTDWIVLVGNIYYKIHSILKTTKYKRVYSAIEKQLVIPFNEIKEAYNLQVNLDKTIKLGVEKYFMCKKQYGMYEKLLKKLSPKVIVEVCHYSRQCMLINEIAKKMQIPTLELEHGSLHEEHAAYQYATEKKLPQLPDKILIFSDYWKHVAHLPGEGTELIAVGFPYFEEQVERYKQEVNHKEKTILFISQGTIGIELSRLAVDVWEKVKGKNIKIIYKLHPAEYNTWKEDYPWLIDSCIEVIDNLEHNIYEYFAMSDVQVGVYSTAVYEGLGFGLKTMIFNAAFAETMSGLIEQGYAILVNNADEVVNNLECDDGKNATVTFWKTNALENIKAVINFELAG